MTQHWASVPTKASRNNSPEAYEGCPCPLTWDCSPFLEALFTPTRELIGVRLSHIWGMEFLGAGERWQKLPASLVLLPGLKRAAKWPAGCVRTTVHTITHIQGYISTHYFLTPPTNLRGRPCHSHTENQLENALPGRSSAFVPILSLGAGEVENKAALGEHSEPEGNKHLFSL